MYSFVKDSDNIMKVNIKEKILIFFLIKEYNVVVEEKFSLLSVGKL